MAHPGIDLVRTFLADSGLDLGGADTSVEEQRAAMEAAIDPEPPTGVTVVATEVGGRPAERITPRGARDSDGVVLYLHGGGYCIGSLATHRNLAARLAVAAGVTVVTLDYRLAPEHPFPAAVDDALAAYRELAGAAGGCSRVAVAGDSAGGGLTVATLLAARDAGLGQPAAAACLSPWADLTQSAPSYDEAGGRDPLLTRDGLDRMAADYLAGADPRLPLASPALAEDLSGLAPLVVEVGEDEALRDDAVTLARRVEEAGGSARLTVWPEMVHVFQAFPAELIPESDASIGAVAAFLGGALAGISS